MEFIPLDLVLELHELSLEAYGGTPGLRDQGLLESAISQPMATWGQKFLHEYPFEMAAADLFHIASNHPFIDGNKRTALAVAIAFLSANKYKLTVPQQAMEDLVLRTASGLIAKPAIAEFFRKHCRLAE